MPKLRNDGGSKHQTENMVALNTKERRDGGFERQNWKVNGGSERLKWNRDGGSKCPNWEEIVALNAETKKRWWLWTPKLRREGGSERQNWEGQLWTS